MMVDNKHALADESNKRGPLMGAHSLMKMVGEMQVLYLWTATWTVPESC